MASLGSFWPPTVWACPMPEKFADEAGQVFENRDFAILAQPELDNGMERGQEAEAKVFRTVMKPSGRQI